MANWNLVAWKACDGSSRPSWNTLTRTLRQNASALSAARIPQRVTGAAFGRQKRFELL